VFATQDKQFRRIVVGSTGLGLACMLASLAAIRIDPQEGLRFGWHWSILLVGAVALIWNARFWKAVWASQREGQPRAGRALSWHVAGLAALGLGSFLYPIRFIERSEWLDVSKGLVTAVLFLGVLCWLMIKWARGFAEFDASEQKRLDALHQAGTQNR
jgi:hypothetical protein